MINLIINHAKIIVKLVPPRQSLLPHMIVEGSIQKKLFGNFYVPLSEHIFIALREALRDLLPSGAEYERAFNRFEYLFSLACGNGMSHAYVDWALPGWFGWTPDTFSGIIMPELKKRNCRARL